MDFNLFQNIIKKIKDHELTGFVSHKKMAPLSRIESLENKSDLILNKARKAAVMMLFYPKNNETNFVLIIRNSYPGVHSAQIAFPGGKVEQYDSNLQVTALRETFEEIGVHPEKINVIREFTNVYIPPSNFIVHPFLGISKEELQFTIQINEVAEIIEIPLSLLLDDKIIVNKTIETSYAKSMQVPAFQFYEHIVWGATAIMLSELKDMIKLVM